MSIIQNQRNAVVLLKNRPFLIQLVVQLWKAEHIYDPKFTIFETMHNFK